MHASEKPSGYKYKLKKFMLITFISEINGILINFTVGTVEAWSFLNLIRRRFIIEWFSFEGLFIVIVSRGIKI